MSLNCVFLENISCLKPCSNTALTLSYVCTWPMQHYHLLYFTRLEFRSHVLKLLANGYVQVSLWRGQKPAHIVCLCLGILGVCSYPHGTSKKSDIHDFLFYTEGQWKNTFWSTFKENICAKIILHDYNLYSFSILRMRVVIIYGGCTTKSPKIPKDFNGLMFWWSDIFRQEVVLNLGHRMKPMISRTYLNELERF